MELSTLPLFCMNPACLDGKLCQKIQVSIDTELMQAALSLGGENAPVGPPGLSKKKPRAAKAFIQRLRARRLHEELCTQKYSSMRHASMKPGLASLVLEVAELMPACSAALFSPCVAAKVEHGIGNCILAARCKCDC